MSTDNYGYMKLQFKIWDFVSFLQRQRKGRVREILSLCSPAAWQAACCDCLESVLSLFQKTRADSKSHQTRKLISLLLWPFCHKGPDLFPFCSVLLESWHSLTSSKCWTTGLWFFPTLSDFMRLLQRGRTLPRALLKLSAHGVRNSAITASHVAQRVKLFYAESDNLGLISWTFIVEGKNQFPYVVLRHLFKFHSTHIHIHATLYIHYINK